MNENFTPEQKADAVINSINMILTNIGDIGISAKDSFKMAGIMSHLKQSSEILQSLMTEYTLTPKVNGEIPTK